jgi:pyruvate/2-oxoglutarate dehydrogenase complex dihydrolipoamide dehydrogenase (E3) component
VSARRYDMVVIGGGTGGLVTASIAASAGAKVALIERERTGGDCLWTGCVPSKALIESAALAHRMRHAQSVGLPRVEPEIDFGAVMNHVRSMRDVLAPHDSPERLERAGIEVIVGHGCFAGPGQIAVGERDLRYRTAVIATGSRPILPPVPGLAGALTTDTVWDLRDCPRHLVVVGGGPSGCELAQAFARLGVEVTIVERTGRLLGAEEPRAADLVLNSLRSDGVKVRLGASLLAARPGDLDVQSRNGRTTISCDRVVVAAGRRPFTDGLELEAVAVGTDENGAIIVDDSLRTTARDVYAVGDVTGTLALPHVAAHQGRVASLNALFPGRRRRADYKAVPRVTFTDPEIASVGWTEKQARQRFSTGTRVAEFDYDQLDRAILAGRPYGFAKLIGDSNGRLIGATVAAPGGGETIAELAAWVAVGASVARVSHAVHAYPTLSEGPSRAADDYLRERFAASPTRRYARLLLAARRTLRRQ